MSDDDEDEVEVVGDVIFSTLGDTITCRPINMSLDGSIVNCVVDDCEDEEKLSVMFSIAESMIVTMTVDDEKVSFKDKKSSVTAPSWTDEYYVFVELPKKFIKTK